MLLALLIPPQVKGQCTPLQSENSVWKLEDQTTLLDANSYFRGEGLSFATAGLQFYPASTLSVLSQVDCVQCGSFVSAVAFQDKFGLWTGKAWAVNAEGTLFQSTNRQQQASKLFEPYTFVKATAPFANFKKARQYFCQGKQYLLVQEAASNSIDIYVLQTDYKKILTLTPDNPLTDFATDSNGLIYWAEATSAQASQLTVGKLNPGNNVTAFKKIQYPLSIKAIAARSSSPKLTSVYIASAAQLQEMVYNTSSQSFSPVRKIVIQNNVGKIELTRQFIYLQSDSSLIVLDKITTRVLSKSAFTSLFFVSQRSQPLVATFSSSSTIWRTARPMLVAAQVSEGAVATLKARSAAGQQCETLLKFKVEKDGRKLYPTGKTLDNSTTLTDTDQLLLNLEDYAVGNKLSFYSDRTSGFDVSFSQDLVSNLEGLAVPTNLLKAFRYNVDEQPTTLLATFANKQVQIFKCVSKCISVASLNTETVVDCQFGLLASGNPFFAIVLADAQTSLRVFDLDAGLNSTIDFSDTSTLFKSITSIAVKNDVVLLLRKKSLIAYRLSTEQMFVLNNQILAAQGFTDTVFLGTKVEVTAERVFLLLKFQLLLIEMQSLNLKAYKSLPLSQSATSDIVVAGLRAIVLQCEDGILCSKASVVNTQVDWPQGKQKTTALDLFGGQVQFGKYPISNSKYLALRTTNANEGAQILVYNLDASSIRSLARIFYVDNADQSALFDFGSSAMLLQVNKGGLQTTAIHKGLFAKVSPAQLDQNLFLQKKTLKLIGKGWDNATSEASADYQVVNYDLKLLVTEKPIPDLVLDKGRKEDELYEQLFSDSEWFKGNVLTVGLQCADCLTRFKLVPPVHFQQNISKVTPEIVHSDKDYLLALDRSVVYFYNQSGATVLPNVPYSVSKEVLPQGVAVDSERKLAVVLAFNDISKTQLLFSLHDPQNQFSFMKQCVLKAEQTKFPKSIGKTHLIGNYLTVLSVEEGTIYVFQINKEEGKVQLNNQLSKEGSLIRDYELVAGAETYLLLATLNSRSLCAFTVQIKPNSIFTELKSEEIDFSKEINFENYLIDFEFNAIKVLSSQLGDVLEVVVLLTTSATLHVQPHISFKIDKTTNNACYVKQKIQFYQSYSRIGQRKTMQKVDLYGNQLVIGYDNKFLAYYQLVPGKENPRVVTSFGGAGSTGIKDFGLFKNSLFVLDDSSFKLFSLRNNSKLVITKVSELKQQNLTLAATGYTGKQAKLTVKVTTINGGIGWWIYVVAGVGVLLLIAVVGFCIYRYKKKKNGLLNEDDTDDL